MNIRVKSHLVLAATFSLGLIAGILATKVFHHSPLDGHASSAMGKHMPPGLGTDSGMADALRAMLEHHLESTVGPTEAQRGRLQPVFLKMEQRLHEVHRSHLQLIGPMLDSMDAELASVLTPEQMDKWRAHRHLRQMRQGRLAE